jgi:hypothetical protein
LYAHMNKRNLKTQKTTPTKLKRERQATKWRQRRRQPFLKWSVGEINLSLARRTSKSLKPSQACTCWSEGFHVLGKKNDKKIGPSSFRPWEIQATPKAPSFLQLSYHGWIPHRRTKVLRKLKAKPRHKIAVLEMNAHLHPRMSFPHQGRSSWYLYLFQLGTSLNLDLFLRGHSLLPHISTRQLTLSDLIVTQLSLQQSMHVNQLVPTNLSWVLPNQLSQFQWMQT